MSLYRLYFIGEAGASPLQSGPDVQFVSDGVEEACKTAEGILADLPSDDPAVAFCLVDSDAGRIVYTGMCRGDDRDRDDLRTASTWSAWRNARRNPFAYSASALGRALRGDDDLGEHAPSLAIALASLRRLATLFTPSRTAAHTT